MQETENKQNQTETETEAKENPASRIWDQAKEHARGALDWGIKLSQVGKLKLDLARIQRDRQSLYQELGRKTHELLKDDAFDSSSLGDLCTKIDQVSELIAKQKAQVEEVMNSDPRVTETDLKEAAEKTKTE